MKKAADTEDYSEEDKLFMQRCLQLAKFGLGQTYPNPLVGAVIVNQGKIIGEGWHRKAGEAHAEVVAIQSVKDSSLLKTSKIYVSLEPCNHFGKTPPCTKAILEAGIPEVYLAVSDQNPVVNGSGIRALRENGIKVHVGLLEKEAFKLNIRFFTYHLKKRPYVILKWAENQWGQIGSSNPDLGQVTITNQYARQMSHLWRTQEAGILIGKNTAQQDNPSLNARLMFGSSPIRIVLDSKLDLPPDLKIFRDEHYLRYYNQGQTSSNSPLDIPISSQEKYDLQAILQDLYRKGIQSILVEGGSKTLQGFIDLGLWDEIRRFKSHSAPFIQDAVQAPIIPIKSKLNEGRFINKDELTTFTPLP